MSSDISRIAPAERSVSRDFLITFTARAHLEEVTQYAPAAAAYGYAMRYENELSAWKAQDLHAVTMRGERNLEDHQVFVDAANTLADLFNALQAGGATPDLEQDGQSAVAQCKERTDRVARRENPPADRMRLAGYRTRVQERASGGHRP